MSEIKDFGILGDFEELFDQVISGYKQKLFYLVIPALFILIEGIIADNFKHEGKLRGGQLGKYIISLIYDEELKSLESLITERMYSQFYRGDDNDSPVNRHAILHGGDPKFGTESTALRLLLIFFNLSLGLLVRSINTQDFS